MLDYIEQIIQELEEKTGEQWYWSDLEIPSFSKEFSKDIIIVGN